MTIAPERPSEALGAFETRGSLLAIADDLWEELPGYRVEIIDGALIVTPPADGPHGESLTHVTGLLINTGLNDGETKVLQAIGIWFGAKDDYAVPDFAIVDADYREHLVQYNCYEPSVFRMVLEVTSRNRGTDLVDKRAKYAAVGIPVYVIADRKKEVVVVLTKPKEDDYQSEVVHTRGTTFELPESVGGAVPIEVDRLLGIRPGE